MRRNFFYTIGLETLKCYIDYMGSFCCYENQKCDYEITIFWMKYKIMLFYVSN